MTKLLIILVLLWPLFWLLRVLFITRILMGFEFRPARVKPHPPEEIAPHLREAAQAWILQLQRQGFQLLGGWRVNVTPDPALEEEVIVLRHDREPVLAVLAPHEETKFSGDCWLSLRTTLADGSELVTNSRLPEAILPVCKGVEIEVLPTVAAAELLQGHLARLAKVRTPAWACPDLAAAAERQRHVRDACLNDAVILGLLTKCGDGGCHYRAAPALRQAGRIIRLAAKNKKGAPPPRLVPAAPLSAESLATFDLHHYRQSAAYKRGRFSLRMKAIISTVSFVLFAGVLAWQYSWAVAIALIGALVIHEGGHLLGMRWFGYRDTQLLFIPFFGGAAIGHDDQVLAPWKHIVIILLGPLPGIFLGLAVLVFASGGAAPEWINQAALTTLFLNGFNLLPILPLDGGQIVDFAIASRFPRARVLFLALSSVGLLLTGLGLGNNPILFGVGVMMLIRLPVEWRLAGVRLAVREEFPDGGEEEPIVRRLLELVRAPEWTKVPMSQRLQMVRGLKTVMCMPRPRLGTLCLALAGFTSPLWLGAPLAVWSAVRQGENQVHRAIDRATAAGLTGTPAVPPVAPAGLKPEDNAAPDFARAEAIVSRASKTAGGATAATEDEDEEEPAGQVQTGAIMVLRRAAHKKYFLPENSPQTGRKQSALENRSRALALRQLTQAADERIRYQEPLEGAAIAADTLRLLRLMQASPGTLPWDNYVYLAESCWTEIEEALATEARPSPQLLADLRELSAEKPVIDFAVKSIPQGMVDQSALFNDPVGENEALNRSFRLLLLIQKASPQWARYRTEAIDQAIAVQATLQQIQRGAWPVFTTPKENESRLAMQRLAQFSDLIARLRQVRVALRLGELRAAGKKGVPPERSGLPPADLEHPLTREPVQYAQRGALDVLTFTASTGLLWGNKELGDSALLVWRVPRGK